MDINDREIEVLLRRLQLLDRLEQRICVMRVQIGRQRHEVLQLQRAGISTAAPELLLGRMHSKIDDQCAERDRLKEAEPLLKQSHA